MRFRDSCQPQAWSLRTWAGRCSRNGGILLAKSLQGDNRKPYSALWLSLSGQKSCFRPVWRHDASRFSRGSSAPANSPAVSEGLRCNGVTVLPDQAHNAVSPDPAARDGAGERLRWAVHCLEAMGGEVLAGPFHQPLGDFTGEPATAEWSARLDGWRGAGGGS